MNNFEKEAQKRSVTKAVGRAINPMEWVRQLSSQKYRSLIREVDRVDDQMRKKILGLRPALREQLHQARMAMKNHEYRTVFQYATSLLTSVDGVFVERMSDLDAIGKRIYEEFSKDRMSDEEKAQFEEDLFREPYREKSSELNNELVIQAGVTQWIQEKMPTKRELEGNLFNKLFHNISGKQQEAAREALSIAERTYEFIKEAFERLDEERRNIVEYVKLAREYHKKFILEKHKLQKMYVNYFPATEKTPPPPAVAPATGVAPVTSPTPVVPPVPAVAPAAPAVPVSKPISLVEEPSSNLENPTKTSAVNDLISRAKIAMFNGDKGICIALLVKASELCDEYGDDQRSIGLLKSAANLDRIRGYTADYIYYDDDANF